MFNTNRPFDIFLFQRLDSVTFSNKESTQVGLNQIKRENNHYAFYLVPSYTPYLVMPITDGQDILKHLCSPNFLS